MNRRLRNALAVTAVLGASLLMTACKGDITASASDEGSSGASASASASGASGQSTPTASTGSTGSSGSSTSGGSGSGSSDSDDSDTGWDKTGVGQSCGSNDLDWSYNLETQGGGYYLIKVKAKSGITCTLPQSHPVVAFGSDGTEASAAERYSDDQITLSGTTTAYAGVVTKPTNTNDAPQYDGLIVSVSDDDDNPLTLDTGSNEVEAPMVSNWHTKAADVVGPLL
ncbi:DUF4232 domain-containing protein [Streptomyces sp. NPDC002588]|uniref:DUF4232 domain-containing protein n=1 Tax=Streptomyces sp. NPDC002588 TaxID=3154419 RepID=UPI003330B818